MHDFPLKPSLSVVETNGGTKDVNFFLHRPSHELAAWLENCWRQRSETKEQWQHLLRPVSRSFYGFVKVFSAVPHILPNFIGSTFYRSNAVHQMVLIVVGRQSFW